MLLSNILEQAGLPGNDENLQEGDWTPQDSFRTVQRMARNMRKHNFFALKDGLNELEDLGMHDSDIATAIKQVKPEILIWFEHGLAQKSHTNQLIYQMFLLLDIGIEWRELAKLLEDNKDEVIRSILRYLQKNVQDNFVLMHIKGYIERFDKLGIRWPELKTVWTSVSSELKKQDLDEATSDDYPDWFAAIVDYIGDTDIAGAVNMCKTYNVNAKNTPIIANYMESNRWYLMRYLERCLGMSFQGFDEINKDIKGLKYIGVNWPELDTFYDDNKDKVMRLLLQQVKSEDEDAGYYTWQEVNALRQARVDWPELDIVMKGAMSLMDRKDIDEDDSDRRREMRYDDDSAYDAYEAKQAAIEAYFSDGLRNLSSDLSDLGDLAYTMKEMGASDRDISDLIKDDLLIIIEWFEENVASNDADSIMDFIDLLDDTDCLDNDEIRQRIGAGIENNKDAIVAQILKGIKGGNKGINGTRMLSKVVDWPELGVILRSMEADAANKRLAEASSNLYPNKIQNIIERGLDNIRHGGAYYIRTLRDELLSQRNVSEQMVADIFNMNKLVLIHALSTSIRHGDPTDLLSSLRTLKSVLGKPWPEAAAILVKHLPDIKDYITSLVGGSGWGMGYSNAVHLYQYITDSGVDDAIIKELKGFIRDRIVTVLKNSIKQHGFGPAAFDGIEALGSLNVRVDIGKGAIKDALLSSFAQALSKEGLNRSDRFVKTIIRSGDVQLRDEMKKVIEEHKVPIIRNMLGLIRVNAAYSVYPSLTTLQHLGFKWDELRIISKALKDLSST